MIAVTAKQAKKKNLQSGQDKPKQSLTDVQVHTVRLTQHCDHLQATATPRLLG